MLFSSFAFAICLLGVEINFATVCVLVLGIHIILFWQNPGCKLWVFLFQFGIGFPAVILDYSCSNWRCQLEWPRSNGKFLSRGLLETCCSLLLRLLMSCSLCGLSLFSCSLIDPSVYFWEHLHCANILPTIPPSFSVDPWGHDPSHGGSDSHQPLAAARNLGPRHTRKPPRITIFSLKYHPLTFSFLCIVGQKARDFASFFNQIQAALHQCTMG